MTPAPPPPLPPGSRGRRALNLRRAIARMSGARLCYGKPVTAGKRTVIPVATVQITGGGGYGHSESESPGTGGGGGGWITARPVGYIEVSPERARFRLILEPVSLLRALVGVGGLTLATRQAMRRRAARRRSRT